jgi:cell division septation protein DedD
MRATIAVAVTLLLVSCSAEKSDWQDAQAADTAEAYEQFISKHPQSALATEARTRTKQLEEEKDWEKATGIDTADSYQAFLAKYPEGKWSEEARIRIENFNVLGAPATAAETAEPAAEEAPKAETPKAETPKAEAPAAAATKPAPAKVEAPKAAPAKVEAPKPAPVAAKPAPAAAKPAGGYRVQLGAFSSADKANGEWQRLKGKYTAQLGSLTPSVVPVDAASGKLYRLQAIVGERDKARATCSALTGSGQACVVVAPK